MGVCLVFGVRFQKLSSAAAPGSESEVSQRAMQLRYYLNEHGKRVYTLESTVGEEAKDDEKPTFSAHPARFSPDDKYSEQRIKTKKRFGVLKIQQKAEEV